MAKQLNVNLAFTADTGKAKAQLQDLQKQLSSLINNTGADGFAGPITEASKAAAELKVHLQNATNIKTGSLDFTKLNDSIKASGKSLVEYGEQLNSMGPAGQKAFMSLAQSVANSEVPIKRANAALAEMWTTLKNTARWQISSSILHGFMGAVQTAYGYAQDLNESLNNIRIVTGQNVEQMAAFADQANKAAKALSTTTTAYTNAALIYYQQGDDDSTVLQKTDVTTKMANVTGTSAEEVSNQLTAIWNNFNKAGEESYERYADVLTALGAATASSTDEIAGGLEKFASIADMIGLSYDYAATALATITATTRQSEDVVGTALKTIFARIQGLNLGETLDDGTTLNKYSEALQKVGISIYEQNGELKDMDNILNEMGAKWETLSDSQQVALAQTVAGVRQYNQLVSLMDNWDYFGENLSVAQNSEGELDKQADIYAESWQAASNRVRAALEGIYSSLIDDESFIDVLNTIEKIITYFDNLIDTVGGLSGVLTTLGAILTKVFSNQLAQSISNIAYNIKMLKPGAQEAVQKEKAQAQREFADIMAASAGDAGSQAGDTASKVYTERLKLQEKMIQNSSRMSEGEKQVTQSLMDTLSVQEQQTIEAAKQVDIAKEKKSNTVDNIYTKAAASAKKQGTSFDTSGVAKAMADVKKVANEARNLDKALEGVTQEGKASANAISQIEKVFNSIPTEMITSEDTDKLEQLLIKLRNIDSESEDWESTLREIKGLMGGIETAGIDAAAASVGADSEDMRDFSNAVKETAVAEEDLKNKTNNWAESNKKVGETIDQAQGKQKTWADSLVSCANSALSVVSALQMVGGIVDTLENPDMSGWDKFLSIGSSVLMMVTMLAPTMTSLIGMFGGTGAAAAGATGPVAGFGVALNTALGPIGWVALALTALIAVFAVIATSIDTASEKAQKRFNQMAEDAKIAADALSEAEDAYNNLQETINSYSEARDNIDSLTKGTEEFKQAIKEANDAARELMETYGIAGKFNAETGLIEIDEDALEQAKEDSLNDLEEARINNTAAQSNKLMASNDLSNAKAAEKGNKSWMELSSDNINIGAIGGIATTIMAASAGIGAPIAAAVAGLSVALGALTGTFEYMAQSANDQEQIAALESLQDAYTQSGGNLEVAMESLSADEKALIDSLGMTDDQLATLCSEVSANTAAMLQNNKQLVDANLENNKEYQDSEHKDELNTLLADDLAKETDRIYDEKWKDQSGGITDKEAQKAYAEMMGYTWVKNKNGNLGVYSKGDGSEDFTVSDETARRALAQKEAMEALGQSVEKYNETLEQVNKTGEKFGDGVGDLMLRMAGGQGASFADATNTEIEALESALADADVATDIISNEDAQNMGYKDAEAYVKALQLGIDSYNDGLANVGNNLSNAFSHGFLTGVEELTLEGAQSMGDNLTNAFKLSGTEAANALDDVFVDAGEDADELSALLESVDWGDPNAVAKLNAAIEEQGLDIDITSDAWEKYTELMSAAGMAMGGVHSKFEQLRSTMSTTNSILKDLDTGSIISDEDYEKLAEINPLIKDMFAITAEGYQFTGSKSALENLLIGNTKESIAGIKEEFEALSSEGKMLTNLNWFDEDGDKAFKSDRDIATIAKYTSDNEGADFDNALAYFGVSQESLQEASDYILQYTDENGNVLTDAEGFDQDTYDTYLSEVKNVYDQLGTMRQDYLDGAFDENQADQLIASTATTVSELQQMYNDEQIGTEAFNQQLQVLTVNGIQAAESLSELHSALGQGLAAGATIEYSTFADALLRLGENFSNTESEIGRYQQALASGNQESILAAQSQLEAAIQAGEMAEKYGLTAEHIERYADELEASGKYQKANEKSLTEMAKDQLRFDKAVISAADNMETWEDDLKVAAKTGHLVAETADQMAEAYGDLLDIDGSELSSEFLQSTENLEDMKKALEGDEEAYKRLQKAAGKDILTRLGIDTSQWDADLAALEAKVLEVEGMGLADIEAGATLNNADFLAALTEMVNQAGMTAQEATDYLSSMGVDAEVVTKPETVTETVGYNLIPTIKTVEGPYGLGTMSFSGVTYEQEPVTQEKQVTGTALEVTSASKSSGGNIKSSGSTAGNGGSNKGGGGGGGGSSKPTADARQRKTDVVERYKEINDALDDMADALDDATKAADRLYGKNRLNAMQKANNLLQSEISLLKQKKSEAENNLVDDKAMLDKQAAELGLSFEYAGNNIVNYTEQMTDLFNRREALLDSFGDTMNEDEQKKLDALDKKIEEFEKTLGLYEETKELIEDIDNEIDDAFYEWQDNNYEMLQLELELKLEVNDNELKKLEYLLNKYSDNFYKMAESAALMNDQIDPTIQNLEDYKAHKEALDAAYSKGEISQEAYMEGLKEVRDGYYENLEALIELDKQMMYYYGDTLDAAQEEIDSFTDHMEHLTGVFEHYTSLMEILGKQKDYDAMGNFLGGQADTIRDRLDTAKEYYEMLKSNSKADEYWANYQAALSSGNDDMAKWWKEQWDAEIDALDEAQEEMLSLTEEWAEAMKAVIENNMNKIAETLEKTLTGGTTFDQMMNEFDKLNTRQEEYLTKTNQIYETNKLMRTASKALDETDNKVAKQKLKNFIDETKSLQENTQLSKYELEIQQAKYDLLLAEIALEEAQNAKSTVRLSQDSEGNFGYVYTADQDAIDNAQQGVEDADNKLYNLSLEGQQEYTEKYLQAQQEMYNELTELQQAWLNGEIASEEEYQRQKDAILNHYLGEGGVLQTYSSLYRIACQTDADAVADNWQTNYGDMTQDTEAWKIAVNQYLEDIKVQTDAWKNVSTQANEDVEGALEDSETATSELKDESSKLADTLSTKVIPAISNEIKEVQAQTAAYAAQREELLALIAQYEAYIDAINKQVEVQNTGFDKDTDYSALMNEYLSKGGSTEDETFKELQRQREAKIAWLQTDEGGNKGADYWGTSGQDTIDKYNRILAGGGTDEENAWFNADYVKDEELVGIFEKLGVPIDEIQAKLDALKEATDNTNTKIDESKDSITETVKETGETTNTKVDEAKEQLNEAIKTSAETTDETIKSTGETSDGVVTDTGESTDGVIEDTGENTVSSLQDVADVISSESGDIQIAIRDAASTVSSSVSSLSGQISSLQGSMTALTAISALDALIPFASGGYTGDWGPEGKLAVLHEKELVLNQGDTANLLTSISFLRDIVSVIDSQASMASMFNMSAMAGVSSNTETLEQMVTIHAEFPNATNHSEIEEAFNNLVNRASQYANRK